MRVLVTGGREFADGEFLFRRLDAMHVQRRIMKVIHGGAKGADALAADWAKKKGINGEPYYADWRLYGKMAGFRRNQKMIERGKPDVIVAFPGGSGTRDMVRRGEIFGIPVLKCYRSEGAILRCACHYKVAFGICSVCGGRGILEDEQRTSCSTCGGSGEIDDNQEDKRGTAPCPSCNPEEYR